MLNRSYLEDHSGHPHDISDDAIIALKKTVHFSPEEEGVVNTLRTLSDPTKLKIFLVLHRVEEIAVSDLALILDLTQSAVSHALADLKKLGLVQSQRCGQLTCYSLKDSSIKTRFVDFFTTYL